MLKKILLGFVLLLPRLAFGSCPATAGKVTSLLPVPGETGVPVNGVVAFGTFPLFAPYDPVVTLTSGGTIASGGLVSGPGGSWIFRPDAPLAPNATYTLQIMDAGTANVGIPISSSFTTGSTSDTLDPVFATTPMLTLPEYVDAIEEADGCTRPGYWNMHVTWDAATDASPILYALDVDIIDLQPEFAGTPYKGIITTANMIDLAIPATSDVTVYVYAIDEAGRQAHSQPATLTVPNPPRHSHHGGCNCEIGATEATSLLPLLGIGGVALLALRRRRG